MIRSINESLWLDSDWMIWPILCQRKRKHKKKWLLVKSLRNLRARANLPVLLSSNLQNRQTWGFWMGEGEEVFVCPEGEVLVIATEVNRLKLVCLLNWNTFIDVEAAFFLFPLQLKRRPWKWCRIVCSLKCLMLSRRIEVRYSLFCSNHSKSTISKWGFLFLFEINRASTKTMSTQEMRRTWTHIWQPEKGERKWNIYKTPYLKVYLALTIHGEWSSGVSHAVHLGEFKRWSLGFLFLIFHSFADSSTSMKCKLSGKRTSFVCSGTVVSLTQGVFPASACSCWWAKCLGANNLIVSITHFLIFEMKKWDGGNSAWNVRVSGENKEGKEKWNPEGNEWSEVAHLNKDEPINQNLFWNGEVFFF